MISLTHARNCDKRGTCAIQGGVTYSQSAARALAQIERALEDSRHKKVSCQGC